MNKEVRQKENGEKKRIRQREKEKRKDGKRGDAVCTVCVSRRLAICVVFYDNYKDGRKALCLEQLVRLSKYYPYSPLPPLAETI